MLKRCENFMKCYFFSERLLGVIRKICLFFKNIRNAFILF
ncbi:hypothetical protein LEP1GSC036_3742 [Leptospira weilii str. 2006001853]|uniref:DCD domain-containing protein n=1 Tax=Leptospira weilii str. 2006001853 TaxID=1001589 RepID=A0A828YZ79_9LEPT|nr:hypothetical protein LEP1GSC036_3742 [Leptospira weilii str. 2006001853]